MPMQKNKPSGTPATNATNKVGEENTGELKEGKEGLSKSRQIDRQFSDTQLGPLTTQKRLNEVESLVEKTKKEGAKVLLGGKRPAGFNKGFYYEPTIFDNVKDDYTIMKVEPFGPLVPMLSFKSFDEIINRFPESEYANDSKEKIKVINDRLAGKEINIAMQYQKDHQWVAAINRYNNVKQVNECGSTLRYCTDHSYR